jgi:hypothetical protein
MSPSTSAADDANGMSGETITAADRPIADLGRGVRGMVEWRPESNPHCQLWNRVESSAGLIIARVIYPAPCPGRSRGG